MSFLDRRGTPTYERGVRVPLICALIALPGLARAELWVTSDGVAPRTLVRRIQLAQAGEGRQLMVQSRVISGAQGPLIHLEAYPAPPELKRFVPDLEDDVARVCAAPEPLHLSVERRPLGPSLLGWWLRQPGQVRVLEAPTPTGRPIAPQTRRVVSGPVASSTLARGGFEWPAALNDLMARRTMEPSIRVIRRVAQILNGGGTIVATVYEPAGPGPHLMGPTLARFRAAAPTLSIFDPSPATRLEVVTLGPAWRPTGQRLEWSKTPWSPAPASERRWIADCAQRLDDESARPFEEAFGLDGPQALVRWKWRPPPEARGTFTMVPGVIRPVPDQSSGTIPDILKMLALALLPLFIAPEAWALGWLQSSLRRKVWTLWPVIVAAYWIIILPGPAKWAAVAPAAAGALHALWPSESAPRPFHRARLARSRSGVSRSA